MIFYKCLALLARPLKRSEEKTEINNAGYLDIKKELLDGWIIMAPYCPYARSAPSGLSKT